MCAEVRVPLVEGAGSTWLRAWARSRARRKSPEACPSEEIDRLYFFEAHRDGPIVAHIDPLGAVHQASPDSCVEIRGFDPLAGRYGETGLSGRLSQVSDLAGLARGGADGAWLRETGRWGERETPTRTTAASRQSPQTTSQARYSPMTIRTSTGSPGEARKR